MAKVRANPARPYGRDEWEVMRRGGDGAYWQGADGLVVCIAVAERKREVKGAPVQPNARPESAKACDEIGPVARAFGLVLGR